LISIPNNVRECVFFTMLFKILDIHSLTIDFFPHCYQICLNHKALSHIILQVEWSKSLGLKKILDCIWVFELRIIQSLKSLLDFNWSFNLI
jgi:hypothetical protein